MADAHNIVPKWLNAEHFTYLLQNEMKSFDKIVDFTARSAMPPGENYSSIMIRVNIEVATKTNDAVSNQNGNNETKTESNSILCCKSSKKSSGDGDQKHNGTTPTEKISYMIKVAHDNELMTEFLKRINTFHIESNTLRNLLPKFESFYKTAGVDVQFGPRAFILPKYPDGNYVLMGDLGARGYKCASRTECVDMAHAHLVLKKLAQYHAGSATYKANNGKFADHYMNGLNTDYNKVMWLQIMKSFSDGFMRNVKLYRDGEKYQPAVAKYYETLDSVYSTLYGYDDADGFNVLSHGDCWTSNMLFKYSESGKVEDVIFVDFQLPSWCSPIKDIMYFIITSIKNDIKLKNFDYYLRYYHEHLVASLKLLKYPNEIPTLRWLHAQSYKYGAYATTASMLTLPIVLYDSSNESHLENLIATDGAGAEFKAKLFANQRYIAHLNDLLPWLYTRGCFNDTK